MNPGNIIIGNDDNKIYTDVKKRLHFAGDSRPIELQVTSTMDCQPIHQQALTFTSLSAANGIVADGLDQPVSSGKVIEIIGVNSGEFVKGSLGASYVQGNTTSSSTIVMIRLTTMYGSAGWEQAGEWRIKLNITVGKITGDFTIFMPAFSLQHYSTIEMYATVEGATYNTTTTCGFRGSLAGPTAATENMVNNESVGSNVVIDVVSTAGFYPGNMVFVSDSANSEWTRITTIVTDTSITVDSLANSYTTANGAKLDIFNYTQTPCIVPISRGMFKTFVFDHGAKKGITFQAPLPQQLDQTSDIPLVFQFMPSDDNPSALVSKWRVQYIIQGLGDDFAESIQYGNLIYADVIPAAVKTGAITFLGTIPYASDHAGKFIFTMELVRLGDDSGDTYTGDIMAIAIIMECIENKLGYEA